MTNDDIAYLRLLADWHDRQARYLLLTVPANIFHTGLPAPLSVIQARYVRLVASVLVVLDRTFDDAEELREFSLRYLAGFANFTALLRIACLVILYKTCPTKNSQPMGYQDRHVDSRSTT